MEKESQGLISLFFDFLKTDTVLEFVKGKYRTTVGIKMFVEIHGYSLMVNQSAC